MVEVKDFDNNRDFSWCPGCGNFAILNVLKKTLAKLNISPQRVMMVGGIGQAGKMAQQIRVNTFHVLHGRTLPVATGVALADPSLKVIAVGGDGDGYAEGGNHIIHAARRNADVTYFVHNNMIYGLTKGQASPTTPAGMQTSTTPGGNPLEGLNPIMLLLGMGAGFVARGFAGDKEQLEIIMEKALSYKGFAFVDILQPCPSFNKVNTSRWFRDRVYDINENGHEPSDLVSAFRIAMEFGERIPTGIFYSAKKKTLREALLKDLDRPAVLQKMEPADVQPLIEDFL